MTQVQRHVFVAGRVQGVGFRASTARQAASYGARIKGFVRNLADGRVEAVFCGDRDAVLEMVAWCKQGPPSSEVSSLEVIEERPDPGFREFAVLRDK